MSDVGKLMFIAGAVLLVLGLAVMLLGRTGCLWDDCLGTSSTKAKHGFLFPSGDVDCFEFGPVGGVVRSVAMAAVDFSALISMKFSCCTRRRGCPDARVRACVVSSFLRMAGVHCDRWARFRRTWVRVSGHRSGVCGRSASWWPRCGRISSGSMRRMGGRGDLQFAGAEFRTY